MNDQHALEELTLDEAAKEFGVSRRTLERLRHQGVLPGFRRGRYLRVRRGDVRRALAFSDPIPLYRELLNVEDDETVEAWMNGWGQLAAIGETPTEWRASQGRWIGEVTRRYGTWPVSDYLVGHAVEAADAAKVEGPVLTFVQAMRGLPQDRQVVEVLRELIPLMNPLLASPDSS